MIISNATTRACSALATATLVAVCAFAGTPPEVRQSRPEKIAEVVADLGYGSQAKHVDAAIVSLAAGLAPDETGWNSSNPRWAAACALIRRNLREDAAEAFADGEARNVEAAQNALADGAVSEDLDAMLAFFRSPSGLRFQRLQNSLTDLSIELSLAKNAAAGGVTVENLDARKQVLEVWLPIAFTRSLYPPAMADRAIDTAYQQFSRQFGPRLDALARDFAADLSDFDGFLRSPGFGRITAALATARQPAPNLAAFFGIEARRHAAAWRAAAALQVQ